MEIKLFLSLVKIHSLKKGQYNHICEYCNLIPDLENGVIAQRFMTEGRVRDIIYMAPEEIYLRLLILNQK